MTETTPVPRLTERHPLCGPLNGRCGSQGPVLAHCAHRRKEKATTNQSPEPRGEQNARGATQREDFLFQGTGLRGLANGTFLQTSEASGRGGHGARASVLGRRTERPDARGGNLDCAAVASEGGPTQEASKKQPLGEGLPLGSCLFLQLPSHPARLSSGRRHAPHPGAPSPASASAAASPAASPAAFCGPG